MSLRSEKLMPNRREAQSKAASIMWSRTRYGFVPAASEIGLPLRDLFAQVAAGRALQEGLDRGARQRHDGLAAHAALFGRSLGAGDETVRQAGTVVLAELHEPVLLVAKQMMAEGGPELGKLLVDLG